MRRIIFIFSVFGFLIISGCTKNSAQVVLQSISFSSETLTVALNSQKQLAPVFTPAVFSTIAVEWSSTDNFVVTVLPGSGGTIQANKVGTAWIKIKDKNSATTGKCLVIVQ